MIKIITYIDRKFDKRNGFSRSSSPDSSTKDSHENNRIYAEEELDNFLNDGWVIISASTSQFVTGAFGAATSFNQLTVILKK